MEPCLFRHGKKHKEQGNNSRPGHASMEPCLFRHGKADGIGAGVYDRLASMEPCLFRHGKLTGMDEKLREYVGFNGAMSFQTW